jgi:hypothetical protein
MDFAAASSFASAGDPTPSLTLPCCQGDVCKYTYKYRYKP